MADDTKFEWQVYYKGKEGYAENLRVTADNQKDVETGRGALLMYLQAQEAVAQPRDREPMVAAPRPAATQPTTTAPQPGVSPTCTKCGSGMAQKPGGITKNPNSPNFGKAYQPFWSCTNYPACDGTARA